MSEKHLTAFLIGFGLMLLAHYALEETWKPNEPRPWSLRALFNYSIGTLGICLPLLYLHPDLWLDIIVSISGAGSATIIAHRIDWNRELHKRDRANGLIEETKEQA